VGASGARAYSPHVATTISVLSQKGGTGKTTMVRTLTDVFERLGLEVLAVDADPQGNLSDYFDTEPDAEPTLAEVLMGQTRAADAIHGSVIPANLRLAEAELALAGRIGREVTLRNALRDLKRGSDLILIDCPPTLGLLTVNALVASDHALLSTQSQYFSLQGVEQAMEVVQLARDSLNPDLELLGVVLNIANMRTKHARQTLDALRERFGDKVFRTVIRQSIAYAESAERAVPILDYRPDRGQDYLSLAGEIVRRLGSPDLLESLDELSIEVVPAGARA
jgi:chromosome partitioning protein